MFWKNYEALCTRIGKSPNAVAKELNISSGSVTEWKHGRVPRWQTLQIIAKYFGVATEMLVSESQDIKEKSPPVKTEELSDIDYLILEKFKSLPQERKKEFLDYLNYLLSKPQDN